MQLWRKALDGPTRPAAAGDTAAAAVWCRIINAVDQLSNTTPAGPVHYNRPRAMRPVFQGGSSHSFGFARSSTFGYRMHARLDLGGVQLLTRTGLDWTHKYPSIAQAVSTLPARQAYLDGELRGVRPDGKTSFSLIQAASDSGNADALVFFLFDLLYLDGEVISAAPLDGRKERLRHAVECWYAVAIQRHQIGRGPEFYAEVCAMSLEGIISKRADAPYAPGDRGLWVNVKCENWEEFVVIGWTDPEGARPWLGALLLASSAPDQAIFATLLARLPRLVF
jgi:ATP-dependent DNA ligase